MYRCASILDRDKIPATNNNTKKAESIKKAFDHSILNEDGTKKLASKFRRASNTLKKIKKKRFRCPN